MINQNTKNDLLHILDMIEHGGHNTKDSYSGDIYLDVPVDIFIGFPHWLLIYMDKIFSEVSIHKPDLKHKVAREFITNVPVGKSLEMILPALCHDHISFMLLICARSGSRFSKECISCLSRCMDTPVMNKVNYVNNTLNKIRELEILVADQIKKEIQVRDGTVANLDPSNFDAIKDVDSLHTVKMDMNNLILLCLRVARLVMRSFYDDNINDPTESMGLMKDAGDLIDRHYDLLSNHDFYLDRADNLIDSMTHSTEYTH